MTPEARQRYELLRELRRLTEQAEAGTLHEDWIELYVLSNALNRLTPLIEAARIDAAQHSPEHARILSPSEALPDDEPIHSPENSADGPGQAEASGEQARMTLPDAVDSFFKRLRQDYHIGAQKSIAESQVPKYPRLFEGTEPPQRASEDDLLAEAAELTPPHCPDCNVLGDCTGECIVAEPDRILGCNCVLKLNRCANPSECYDLGDHDDTWDYQP